MGDLHFFRSRNLDLRHPLPSLASTSQRTLQCHQFWKKAKPNLRRQHQREKLKHSNAHISTTNLFATMKFWYPCSHTRRQTRSLTTEWGAEAKRNHREIKKQPKQTHNLWQLRSGWWIKREQEQRPSTTFEMVATMGGKLCILNKSLFPKVSGFLHISVIQPTYVTLFLNSLPPLCKFNFGQFNHYKKEDTVCPFHP